MKIRILFAIIFAFFVSCKQTINVADIEHLNGYWEIVKVELPDGEEKEFKINETIDFIKFKDEKGVRNKVIPQLDGTLLSNKTEEKFQLIQKDNTFFLLYKTNYATWEEELILISENELVVKNSNDLKYSYKKRNDLKKIKNGKEI